jgi:GMP synthase (glutamine-hydrolysing)
VVGVAASPWDRETICLLSDAAHPDIEEVWAPFAGRFADLVRTRARQAA